MQSLTTDIVVLTIVSMQLSKSGPDCWDAPQGSDFAAIRSTGNAGSAKQALHRRYTLRRFRYLWKSGVVLPHDCSLVWPCLGGRSVYGKDAEDMARGEAREGAVGND